MTQGTGDRWAAGDAYDAYMGRWSRLVAREFLDWLEPAAGGHWLEVGCGTGALTSAICALSGPASVVACDQSAPFVDHLRTRLLDSRISWVATAADTLPSRPGGFDVIASGLVLNFVPEPDAALAAMRERTRPGGIVGAYVWDYCGGVDLLRHFWEEAVATDAKAIELDESRRFERWQPAYVSSLFAGAGLAAIETATLTIPTTFSSFDDYWTPFLGGAGPAPTYVASLQDEQQELLANRLKARLPSAADGSIPLHARALAIRGVRP